MKGTLAFVLHWPCMTRILFVAACAFLAAGCATYGQPGANYPYGPGPYGPDPGYQSPGAYPPGSYPPATGAQCPIRASRNWTAFVNRMPGPDARPKLVVSGDVVTSSAGYRLTFDPHLKLRESYPAQAVAVLQVRPPDGPAAQVVETHQLRWEWPLSQSVGSLEIVCEGQTLARISRLENAY